MKLPVIAAPMFLISGPELVIACCRAGIVGSFPALNQRTSDGLRDWIQQIKQAVGPDALFAVNLIVHPTNPRLQADLQVVIEEQVPIVITSLGAVPDLVQAVHSYGGLVYHDVTTRRHAEKAAAAGVDGIIAVAAGAGGHAGRLSPFALAAEVKSVFDGDLILAGCMNTGADVLAARALGAKYAYFGTRFINTLESEAADDYRQMVIDCGADDVSYTDQVSGIWGNFLTPSLQAAGTDRAVGDIDLGAELIAPTEGAKAWKNLWSAGQGVAGIQDCPSVAELVQRMQCEYRDALAELSR